MIKPNDKTVSSGYPVNEVQMDLNNQKYNVIYKGRKAVIFRYFDSVCLLFDKKDGEVNLRNVTVLDDYPEGYYCVFFSQISIEERKQIRSNDGEPLFMDCVCSLFIDDRPNSPLLNEYIEILGDDPIDYETMDEFADPSQYVTVKCKTCGRIYKVNRNMGYRSSFFKWTYV